MSLGRGVECFSKDTLWKIKTLTPPRNRGIPRENISRRRDSTNKCRGSLLTLKVWQFFWTFLSAWHQQWRGSGNALATMKQFMYFQRYPRWSQISRCSQGWIKNHLHDRTPEQTVCWPLVPHRQVRYFWNHYSLLDAAADSGQREQEASIIWAVGTQLSS